MVAGMLALALCLTCTYEAYASIESSATFNFVNYKAEQGGETLVKANSFYQEYSVLWKKQIILLKALMR